jgi:hypothetical protein
LLVGQNLANQQAGKVKVWGREFTASVHHQNCGVSLLQRDFSLAKDFCRDQIFFIKLNPTRVHDAQAVSAKVSFAVQPIARDPRFVADDGPA